MRRGRLLAYANYQLQDFLLLRAGAPVIFTTLFGFMLWKTTGRSGDWNNAVTRAFLPEMFRILAGLFIALGSFMGIARLVTDDRSNGYYRFLFSKPVSIPAFYVQQWVLFGVTLVALTGLLAVWLEAGTAPLPVGEAMKMMGLYWFLFGGIGLFLSSLTNYDAVLLVLVYIVSNVLHSLRDVPRSPLPAWLSQLTRVTPPIQKLDYIRDQIYHGNPMPWPHAWHVIGYGAACFVAAVIVLRRRSFAH